MNKRNKDVRNAATAAAVAATAAAVLTCVASIADSRQQATDVSKQVVSRQAASHQAARQQPVEKQLFASANNQGLWWFQERTVPRELTYKLEL